MDTINLCERSRPGSEWFIKFGRHDPLPIISILLQKKSPKRKPPVNKIDAVT